MNQIEIDHVSKVYDEISKHFSSTRYAHWKSVKEYLESVKNSTDLKNSELTQLVGKKINFLDFGCGNGKYLSFGETFNTWAFDNCTGLLEIVSRTYPSVKIIKGNVSDSMDNLEKLGLKTNYFDSIISVAVIHHISTELGRIQTISNIINMLKPQGTCLITAWACTVISNDALSGKSKFVKLSGNLSGNLLGNLSGNLSGDYLVSWNNKYQRFYHLFEPTELEELIDKTGLGNQVELIRKINECDNWIVILRKK
jgi:tRNA (uracil-5-)-methyltransferase TRM9